MMGKDCLQKCIVSNTENNTVKIVYMYFDARGQM
jgi:hypothetical protein